MLGYDAENWPVSVAPKSTTTAYIYCPDSERLKKLTPQAPR